MSAVRTTHRQMGSKARVARELLRLVPSDVRVWVEGFAGTAAMTLAKAPHPAEHLNDLNGDVVNLFEVLRDDCALSRLCHLLTLTPYAQEEFESARDQVWRADPDDDADPVERARLFLVATWQAIGGKQVVHANWRLDIGRSWLINTWHSVPERLQVAAQRLRFVQIHRRHIAQLVKMFSDTPEAILFLDPPYPRDTLATHETPYRVDMDPPEHEALAQQLRGAQCKVLLTMAPGTVYERVLEGWHQTPYRVRGLRNAIKTEIALTNYPPPIGDLFANGGG